MQKQPPPFKAQKTHHFSYDDEEEEEDEDGAIKGIPLPVIPMVSDEFNEESPDINKPSLIRVEGKDGEDLT